MSYVRTTWSNGDTITATKLNNIETGILGNESNISTNATNISTNTTDIGNLQDAVANDYDSTSTYAVGDYVYYSGYLYRCSTAITTAEAWTAGHWTAVVLGDGVTELKIDLNEFTLQKGGININSSGYEGGYINSSGGNTGSSTYSSSFRSSDYIPVESGKTVVWWGYLTDDTALGGIAYIAEYDESKAFIQRNTNFKKYGSSTSDYSQTLSATTKYVRIALLQGVEDKSTIRIALYYLENAQASYVDYTTNYVVDYNQIYNSDGDSADSIIDSKIDAVGLTPLYAYEEITATGQSGALYSDGSIVETDDVTRYYIPVTKGEKYVVSARHGYAYRAFLVLDSDSNVLSYYPTTTSGTEIHRNVEVEISEDGYLVVQDVYNFVPYIGKVSSYSSGDKLYQKSIYWDGDSICFGAGGFSFANQIGLFHAMEETMGAVSGTRLTTRDGYTNSIYERVVALDTSEEWDYIGIEGGYNDYFSSVSIGSLTADYTTAPDTTTVIGAVEGICQFIRTNFPTAKFFFVLGHRPIAVGVYSTDVDTYWDAIITALEKWAVPYVDIRREGTLMAYNADWLADYFGEGETMGTHPNTEGYTKFYNPLVEDRMKSL